MGVRIRASKLRQKGVVENRKSQKSDESWERVLTGHLADDDVEIHLVLVVDEPVVEHALTLVAEEAEDLGFVSHLTRLTLQDTCRTGDGAAVKLEAERVKDKYGGFRKWEAEPERAARGEPTRHWR